MNPTLVLSAGPGFRYAREVLRERLRRLGISVVEDDRHAPSGAPRLRLACGPAEGLDGQGLCLRWAPPGFDSSGLTALFTFSSEELPQEMAVGSGDTPGEHNGIFGDGPDGVLYGVLEFCERCEVHQSLPPRLLEIRRSPRLKLRSACLQLMRAGRYDVDITPQEFPWFYDRAWWTRYLDFLASHRWNAVALWNFHPFPYFVPPARHAGIQVLEPAMVEANRDHLRWLVTEAGRRSIRLIFHFYNIYVSRPFARSIGMKSIRQFSPDQADRVSAYVADSLSSFVAEFPEVGLMPCLGEGVPGGQAERFAGEVLLPAVTSTGHRPLFIVRQWSTLTPREVQRHILGRYEPLFVMLKHNAEHIASEVPDARLQAWLNLGVPCLVNMHMITEVDPFRWSPPEFIRTLCLNYQASGVQGVHVYPHWSWRIPHAGDAGGRLEGIDRDWLYHSAWGRYSFDPVRDGDEEERHWTRQGAPRFGGENPARAIVRSQNRSARVLPRIQQHLWAHYDNHSVLAAGFTLGQLAEAKSVHGRLFVLTDRHEDLIPPHEPGEGPGQSLEQTLQHSREDIDVAIEILKSAGIRKEDGEAGRYLNDATLIRLVVKNLSRKWEAVCAFDHFFRTGQGLSDAVRATDEALERYRELAEAGDQAYEAISDVNPNFPTCLSPDEMPYRWADLVPFFEEEAANVRRFANAVEKGNPVRLAYRIGSPRHHAWDEHLSQLTQRDDVTWLIGCPDFLPRSWVMEHVDHIEVCLTDNWIWNPRVVTDFEDYATEWLQFRPGREMIFWSHPDSPSIDSGLIKMNLCALKASGLQRPDFTLTYHARAVPPSGRIGVTGNLLGWQITEQHDDTMLTGHIPTGKSTLRFHAL